MKVMLWTMLLTLIGCAPDPSKSAPSSLPLPDKPGVSLPIAYPVLMAGNKTFRVFDDEETLTTTRVSSGFYYGDMAMIDSGGDLFKTVRITDFDRKPAWRDMGTSPYRVFLDLQSKGKPNLDKLKAMLIDVARENHDTGLDYPNGLTVATQRIQVCKSVPELIKECRNSGDWR
jgi:hypothetical protein